MGWEDGLAGIRMGEGQLSQSGTTEPRGKEKGKRKKKGRREEGRGKREEGRGRGKREEEEGRGKEKKGKGMLALPRLPAASRLPRLVPSPGAEELGSVGARAHSLLQVDAGEAVHLLHLPQGDLQLGAQHRG